MSELTVRDGKLLVRDEKLGTEQECCCPTCECVDCPELTFESTASFGGMSISASSPVPGAASARFDKNDGSGDYIEISLLVICGEVGPNGECGWLFVAGVCYQSDGFINSETHGDFQPQDDDGCPDTVSLSCLGFCSATVTGSVS